MVGIHDRDTPTIPWIPGMIGGLWKKLQIQDHFSNQLVS